MSNDGHNSISLISLDAVWMDMLRSLAILAVVIHHWLLFNPHSSSVRIFTNIADLIQTLAGTVVHLFSFYVIEFSLGMFIGYRLAFYPRPLDRLVGLKMFCIGIGLYAVSWSIQRYWSLGGAFNDLFTAAAVFLMTLNLCWLLVRLSPQKMVSFSKEVSKHSYVMYLIHGPLILFVMKPLLAQAVETPINSMVMVFLACLYCVLIFVLARFISPLMKLTIIRERLAKV